MSTNNYANKEQLIDLLQAQQVPILGAGGGFAPIGTRAYFDGTLAPQGWLICDGSTHNIADYPELSAYFASHHGSSNYYGGNGTTTFATPVMNGMPNGGVDTPDEHIIGEWRETVDGVLKYKPVYEKTVKDAVTLTNNTYVQYSIGTSCMIIDYDGQVKRADGTTKYLIKPGGYSGNAMNIFLNETSSSFLGVGSIALFTTASDLVGKKVDITFKYIKTTDTFQPIQEGHSSDGNGVFCIKATVSGNPEGHVYSTEEQIVGTWIDGSLLYEKTITFNRVSLSPNTWIALCSASGLNIDKLLYANAHATSTNEISCGGYRLYDGNIEMYSWVGFGDIDTIVIRYTKTS